MHGNVTYPQREHPVNFLLDPIQLILTLGSRRDGRSGADLVTAAAGAEAATAGDTTF